MATKLSLKSTIAPQSTRFLKPSVALGLTALGVSGVQGSIIYNDFTDFTLGPDPNPTRNNSSDVDAYFTFNLALQTISVSLDFTPGIQFFVLGGDNFGKGIFVPRYGRQTAPSAVSGTLAAGVAVNSSNTTATIADFSNNVSDGYIGVKIDAGSGNFNYGWIRYATGPGTGPAATITMKSAAYETALNQSIQTGATVPEPSSAALVALAAGAMAFRRRRQSEPV